MGFSVTFKAENSLAGEIFQHDPEAGWIAVDVSIERQRESKPADGASSVWPWGKSLIVSSTYTHTDILSAMVGSVFKDVQEAAVTTLVLYSDTSGFCGDWVLCCWLLMRKCHLWPGRCPAYSQCQCLPKLSPSNGLWSGGEVRNQS